MTVAVVAARECSSFFRTPLGWVVTALLAALSGTVVAVGILEPGRPASMRAFFVVAVHLLLPVVPAISMRLFSEEARTGTLESLLASPAGSLELVLGKFLGAWGFLLLALAPTALLAGAVWLAATPKPDPGPVITGYATLASLGGAYLALGLVVSVATQSQTLAYLGAFMLLLTLMVGTSVAPGMLPDPFGPLLAPLSLTVRLADAGKGVLDVAHLAYFWGLAAMGVGLSATILEAKRCP